MSKKQNPEQQDRKAEQDGITLDLEALEERIAPSRFGKGGGRDGLTVLDPV